MINLNDDNFINLKYDLDDSEIFNDVRVLLPSYSYTLELTGGIWYKIPIDLAQRATNGESINKYGRRCKTQRTHVIGELFAEAYCKGEVEKYHEPMEKLDISIIGDNDTDILTALTIKMSDEVGYINAESHLSNTGLLDRIVLDIQLDQVPRLTLDVTEVRPLDLLGWFIVDVDMIESAKVIG